MKKFLVMLCMLTCVFGLTACGSETELRDSDILNAQKAELISSGMATPYLCSFADDEFADSYLEEYTKEEMTYVAESMFYTFLTTFGTDTGLTELGVNYVYVDGSAFLSGITSFNSAFDTIGELQEIGTATAEVKDDEIVVTVPVVGSEGTATAEFIYDNDIFLTMTAAALNPDATMADAMTKAALNTLLGMGTVFAVLILICLIISAMGIIPKLQEKSKKKAVEAPKEDIVTKSVDNAIAQIVEKEELADDRELVAVIAAAIAAYEGSASTDGFVVRSIRRVRR